MSRALLRGGRLIDPANGRDGLFDLVIAGGIVEAVEPPGVVTPSDNLAVVEVGGCWVTPGLIDPHVHLRDPGFPEKETIASGLRAAAAGGFTTVAAMANTKPVNDSPEIARYMAETASRTRAARLVVISAVTRGLLGKEPVDFAAMAEAGARLFSDDGMPIDDEAVLTRALDELKRLDFAISLHEEDRKLSGGGGVNAGEVSKRLRVNGYPDSAEAGRVRRDLNLALRSAAPVHLAHLSCAESVELVRAARADGARVTCEVTPHHFSLDETAVLRWGPNAKMSPPLRSAGDVEAIRAAIADGTVDIIATDHAPHDPGSKRFAQLAACFDGRDGASELDGEEARALGEAANGVIGLETSLGLALGLVHRGIIGPGRLVEMMAVAPARLLRLDGGALSAGARADVTVIDPGREWTVDPTAFLSRSRNTPFAGMRLRGKAILTIVGGEIVYDGRRTGPA
jgi:dihydroorotase